MQNFPGSRKPLLISPRQSIKENCNTPQEKREKREKLKEAFACRARASHSCWNALMRAFSQLTNGLDDSPLLLTPSYSTVFEDIRLSHDPILGDQVVSKCCLLIRKINTMIFE